MSGFTDAGGEPGFAASRSATIYRDVHETSLTLAVLGGVITVCTALQLVWRGVPTWLSFDWPTAAMIAVAFGALWLTFWRRAVARGMRRPPGFGIATVIGLVAVLPPFVVALIYGGPFISFGVGLTVVGLKLRNRALIYWALGVGGIGVFEGFFGITNRLSTALWADWEHPAIYLALGALTFLAGVFLHIRERNAAY